MKKLLFILPLLAVFFASCEKEIWNSDGDVPGVVTEKGKVTLSLKTEGEFTVVTKSEDAVSVNDLRVRIWKGEEVVKEYAKYSEAPNVIEIEPGAYVLEAGTTGDKEAAWAQPIYNGKQNFTVEAGKVTSAAVVCKLTNMKVTIKCTENFINELNEDFIIVVSNGNQDGFLEYTKSIVEAGTSGYFKVGTGKLTVHVKATRKLNGAEINHYIELASCNAQDHHVLTFDVQEVGEIEFGSDGIKVDYSVNNKEEDIVIPGEDETPIEGEGEGEEGEEGEGEGEDEDTNEYLPTIEPVGGAFVYNIPKSEAGLYDSGEKVIDVIITALNSKTIEHIDVEIDSPALTEEFMSGMDLGSTKFSITDFTDSDADQKRKQCLIDLGLIDANTPIKGKTQHTFKIGGFVSLLFIAASDGQVNNFIVTVTDSEGKKASATVTITKIAG